jgi:hypothetical protein
LSTMDWTVEPVPFVAVMTTVYSPDFCGIPVMRQVVSLMDNPRGRLVAEKDVGSPVACI